MKQPFLIAALIACSAFAQSADGPQFEVASVKFDPRTAGSWANFTPGRLSASSWVKQLIQLAYGVEDYQVAGGPGWLTTDWYDIDARAEKPDAGKTEMIPMLRNLLTDRFKLQLKREDKEFAVYALVLDKGGLRARPLKDGDKSLCGHGNSFMCGIRTSAELAHTLRNWMGRPVLDQTGVTGNYDILLDFDEYAALNRTAPVDYPKDKPSLTTALQKQLGLRLEPQKATFPVLTVESIQRPSEN